MNFVLMIYETPDGFAERTDPAKAPAYRAAWLGYVDAVVNAGIMRGGSGLLGPETATTVRIPVGSAPQVQDGPFADTKEQLGGFFILDLPSLDDALLWAQKCPLTSGGSVEVRPVMPSM